MIIHRPGSNALQTRAAKVLPYGVNSQSRNWGAGKNLYIEKAKGAYVWDVDGNRYIDYRLAFGPVILGYAYDEVDEKVIEMVHKGVTTGLTIEKEIEAAEKVVQLCPWVELVRFMHSGTEASMHAIRLARAFTNKEKIIKFEGGYHGNLDYVLFSTYAPPSAYGNRLSPIAIPASSGIPAAIRSLIITLPFNDREALANTLNRSGHEIAAVISEANLGNYGSIEPEEGFLEYLKEICAAHDVLLILDEVKTGFRIAPGGAAGRYGIRPDLTTYAKAIGNGYPVAAIGGRREIMALLGNGVSQGGTYAGNAISAAAVDATLNLLSSQPIIPSINGSGMKLQDGLKNLFDQAGIQAMISGYPPMFGISFGISEARDARDWAKSDQVYYQKFAEGLLKRGILIDINPREPWCLCYSHSEEDIEETLIAVGQVINELS